MKPSIRSLLATATLLFAWPVVNFASALETGAMDIGPLIPSAKGECVDINLTATMLKFAARLTAPQEPETAELIRNLKSIRVQVVGLDDSNRKGTVEQIEAVRRRMEVGGWAKVVAVRESESGENITIHLKQRGEESIDGIVVTVIDKKGQALFVNIVGDIQADQIALVAEKFNITPLQKLKIKGAESSRSKKV